MNFNETATLLGKIASIDSRTADQLTIASWQELLADVSLPNAMEALTEHRKTKPGVWVEPGHILEGARAARRRHLDRMRTPEPPPELDGDPTREIPWQRAYRAAIGDGHDETGADEVACRAVGVHRAALETAPRNVAALVSQAAATTRIPARDAS